MVVEIFTLCDYAINENGKLTIVGTFDSFGSKDIPFVHDQCALVFKLRFTLEEQNSH